MGSTVDNKNYQDLGVSLAGINLKNPIMPASGVFGYGMEYKDLFDLNLLGAIVTKSITVLERYGNELPRIAECKCGMLNSIGLQNPGLKHVAKHELPELQAAYSGPIIANISGFSIEDFEILASAMDKENCVKGIEVNISCPNVDEGGMAFGTSPSASEEITKAVRRNTKKPFFVKLTPNVTDIKEIAKACESGGADGISLINNFQAMKIDIDARSTVTAKKYAGLSGPAIKPIALRMVNEVFHTVKVPVIGIGGISSPEDVIEMIMAGATAVEIGSANLKNPLICPEIIEKLPKKMREHEIKSLEEIRGII